MNMHTSSRRGVRAQNTRWAWAHRIARAHDEEKTTTTNTRQARTKEKENKNKSKAWASDLRACIAKDPRRWLLLLRRPRMGSGSLSRYASESMPGGSTGRIASVPQKTTTTTTKTASNATWYMMHVNFEHPKPTHPGQQVMLPKACPEGQRGE